jgi:selenide,water dikinase
MENIKLTQYSHGAGCGCKIAPDVLDQMLTSNLAVPDYGRLLVGNHSKDDAAVYLLDDHTALISTTDFFMPIVDDPYNFGRIAAANAISDVYAMGGKPVLAIAILGWPIQKLSPDIAGKVIEGGRSICIEAGIPLAGGHSIDAPEPIFGLAVNGISDRRFIKQNNQAKPGDYLFLTKPLGVGILTTAEKKGLIDNDLKSLAARQMMTLNKAGESLGKIAGVTAMTDVTGFGLLGHLTEMCEGSGVQATLWYNKIPVICPEISSLIDAQAIPGGTTRNLKSYRHKINIADKDNQMKILSLLADPQTSGGLLIAVNPDAIGEVKQALLAHQLDAFTDPVGRIVEGSNHLISVEN